MKVTIKGLDEIAPERVEKARAGMYLYRRKRALIAAIERLDCTDDADLIETISRTLPARTKSQPRQR